MADGTEETLISEDFVRSSPMAVANGWIYYGTIYPYENFADRVVSEDMAMATGEYGIYKIRADGSERTQISPYVCRSLNIEGDWIYYLDTNDSIWKIRTDGSGEVQLSGTQCRSINVTGDWIYYVGMSDNRVYKMRTDGTENTEVSSDYTSWINAEEDWVYYTNYDFVDAQSEDIGLYKMRPDGSEKKQLTNDGAIVPNIAGEWIYYLGFDDEYVMRFNKVRTDGTDGQSLEIM